MKLKHILKAEEFRKIVTEGKKYKGKLVGLYTKGNSENKELTVGVIISKKVAPEAVTRNYLKRIIYLFYAQKRDKILDASTIAVRIISPVEKGKRKTTAKMIRTELEELTRQAKLTND